MRNVKRLVAGLMTLVPAIAVSATSDVDEWLATVKAVCPTCYEAVLDVRLAHSAKCGRIPSLAYLMDAAESDRTTLKLSQLRMRIQNHLAPHSVEYLTVISGVRCEQP